MKDPTTHTYSNVAFDEFVRYAKAFHLSHIVYSCGDEVKYEAVEGNNPKEESWWKKCAEREYTMPSKTQWGKAWFSKHYDYQGLKEFWYLDAADTTHVNADLESELSVKACDRICHLEANETTHLLLHGSKLSRRYPPSLAREMIINGTVPKFCLSMLCKCGKYKVWTENKGHLCC